MGSDQGAGGPDASAGSPGTILRRCREFHGFTLEEASEATKIGVSHLKALEDDRIREFANHVYLKGFLRIYAAYLGLNSDDVARMYDKLFGVEAEKPEGVHSSPLHEEPRRLVSLKKLVFPSLLLVVILVFASFYRRSSPPPVRSSPPAAVPISVPAAAVQAVVSSVPHRKEPLPPAPERGETSRPLPAVIQKSVPKSRPAEAGSKGVILKVKAVQSSSVTVTIDGSAPQQYELAVGDVVEWKAERKVAMELGSADSVDIELNGKPYKVPGTVGKPVYFELEADGGASVP